MKITESADGFTLIELAIGLLILSLIAGGVFVGKSLIKAAEVQATVSQIEQYRVATTTFLSRYGGLPGDLNAVTADEYGFDPRGGGFNRGNGDNLIGSCNNNLGQGCETLWFWRDLSDAHLIGKTFNMHIVGGPVTIANSDLPKYLPRLRTDEKKYIAVAAPPVHATVFGQIPGITCLPRKNYFQIMGLTRIGVLAGNTYGKPELMFFPEIAQWIDAKVDDGLPRSGRVVATDNLWLVNHFGDYYAPSCWLYSIGSDKCVSSEGNYNMDLTTPRCNVAFEM